MGTEYRHTGIRIATMQCFLVVILLLLAATSPANSGETEPGPVETETDQYDIFYDAMLRSIELDTSRWKSFSRSVDSGPWFYDAQSLKRDGSRVTALVAVYPNPNKTELYRSVYSDHIKIRKIIFLTEINCSRQTYRQPQISVHGYYRELLAEHSSAGKNQKFSPIRPGTTTDTLRSLVCGPDRKKKP
jgi:hypothetical protein